MTIPVRNFLFCAALLGAAFVPARADELVTNGGFESGDFTPGWTLTNGDVNTYISSTSDAATIGFAPNSGSYVAIFGTATHDASISQTFSDIVGEPLTLSFFLAGGSLSAADFSVMLNSTLLLSISQKNDLTYVNTGAFTEYTYQFLGTGSDTLTFAGSNGNNYYALDDVSVMPSAPEPASWMLLGTGMVGMIVLGMRRRLMI